MRVDARAAGVVAEARAVLAAAANVTSAAQAARDPFAGPLRIGMIATVAPYLLPFALPDAIRALPRTPLHLIEDLTDRLLARMSEGALDAAVIATDPQIERLDLIELYEEPFYLVSARASRPRRRDFIRVDEINPRTLLLLAEGHCLRDQALALCGAVEREAGADVRATSLETLRYLAAAGQGATLAPLLRLSRLEAPERRPRRVEDRRPRRLAHGQARSSARPAPPRRDRGAGRLIARFGASRPGRFAIGARVTSALPAS